MRAVHLEASWPAGEVEDGERRGRRLREQSETKKGQAWDLGKSGNEHTQPFAHLNPFNPVPVAAQEGETFM